MKSACLPVFCTACRDKCFPKAFVRSKHNELTFPSTLVHSGRRGGRWSDLHGGGQAARRPPRPHGERPSPQPQSRFSIFPQHPPLISRRLSAGRLSFSVREGGDGGEAGAPPPPLLLHGGLLLHHHLPLHVPLLHLHRASAGHPH